MEDQLKAAEQALTAFLERTDLSKVERTIACNAATVMVLAGRGHVAEYVLQGHLPQDEKRLNHVFEVAMDAAVFAWKAVKEPQKV